jgi:hypothetical protein
MELIKFSKYTDVKSKNKTDIDIEQYITIVRTGLNQDLVLKARAEKQKGNQDEYKRLKMTSPVITGSVVMNEGAKDAANISYYNGLIVIDIDQEISNDQILNLQKDRYSFILHRSFGGDGICIFVKINPEKFQESFEGLSEHYLKNYGLLIDIACKNPNRLRYISYDPDLFYNQKSTKFAAKTKVKEIKETKVIFTNEDFGYILQQIKDRAIDLCKDEYYRYIRIGFALFDKFGQNGLEYFDFVCSFGSKYDKKAVERHWKSFNKDGKTTIATFYHYCKEEGIETYSKETIETIKVVKVQKTQGNPTVKSVVRHLEDVCNITSPNEKLIQDLIDSKNDFSKGLDNDDAKITQLEKFIIDLYNPNTNELTNDTYIKGNIRLDDRQLNNIYIAATKFFDWTVSKNDVRDILNSSSVPSFNPIKKYFNQNNETTSNEIEKYILCVQPQNEYNLWAFKKWIVGCIHNWYADINEPKVCPLTLVLSGKKQGTGKTSFFRELLPTELKSYLAETKIDINNKDSVFNLTKNLIVLDDEFGGMATRDVKDFKKIADINIIDMRLPYGSIYSKFKRRASLAGTSNENNILKDVTGNRRILPIKVDKIDYDQMVAIDKDKLWKQAYELYQSGFDWKIYSDADVKFLAESTTYNIDVLPIEEMFFGLFSLEQTSSMMVREIMNQGDILNYMNKYTHVNPTKFDIKDIFVKNNLEYKNYRVNGFIKKGVELFIKDQNQQTPDDIPF